MNLLPVCPAAVRRVSRWLLLAAAFVCLGSRPLLAAAPANDSFGTPSILLGSTNSVLTSNVGATGEAGEPSHAGNAASASIWWTWVAPDSGNVVIDTVGSAIDTVLGVYTGETVNALTLVAENDDAPGLATSLVAFPVVRGTKYRIAVDGYGGSGGAVRLSLRLPVAPSAPSITVQPVSRTVPDNAGSNVTFAVTATGSFPLTFDWQKGGVSQPGGTNASFTISNVTAAQAGSYRVVIANASGSVTSSVVSLTVLAGLSQDMFSGRTSISGQTATVTSHNFGATTEPGEPAHAGANSGASIWWTWTAPQNGLVSLDTIGSTNASGGILDTVLAVYTGNAVNALTPIAANNDAIPGVLASSKLVFRATAGVTYQIAVAGLKDQGGTAAAGFILLNLDQAPNNDFFSNALVFPYGATSVLDNNVGATEEPGEPNHAGNLGGKSVWWTWVAPSNGTYALDTVGSSIDTVLAVYTGSAVGSLTLVGEDDNRSDGGASLVKFFAVGGTTYRFAVDGFTGTNGIEAGPIVLNLNPSLVLNDDFAERVTLSGQTNLVTASNSGAGKEPGEPDHGGNAGGRSIWWTWSAPLSGPVIITTRNSTFDTALAVYTGTQLSSLSLIAENDDSDPLDATAGSVVGFNAVAGQSYQIAVDGYRSGDGTVASGTVVLRVAQPNLPVPGANDLFQNRFPITGQTNAVIGVNTNAAEEIGEPNHAGNDGGRSVWWSWIAPATAPVRFDTIGSGFDTILGVYTGSSVGALTEVASDQRSAGDGKSVVIFEAVQGVEYQIAVDGFNDGTGADSGRVVLRVHQFEPGALHANDDFENASPISDPFLTVAGSNIGATRQSGEPAHSTAQQGHSVWWSWTAQNDGPVTISTTDSQFDTILAVYTGNNVSALSLVAENDDIDPGNLQSSVTFQAVSGTEYRIAVDGYGSEIGFINLTVAPGTDTPSAPKIQQAPTDQTRFAGGGGGGANVAFRVVATGSRPLSYQWLRNGSLLAGATGDLLTVTNAAAIGSGAYQVIVSNSLGVVTSTVAQLAINAAAFNDDFTGRIAVAGMSNIVRGSILGGSKQPNEPHHGGDIGGRSVWWKWTAPANGFVEIHTLGSSFDTLLGVYTGSAPDSLTLVAENDDMVENNVYSSRVGFNALAGQEYQIAVDGAKTNNTSGSVVLSIRQSPPPLIVVQPVGLSVVHVTNTQFSLGAATSGPTSENRYQWFFNGGRISNATNATLAFGQLSRTNNGTYAVSVTNAFGGVLSSNAVLTVQVPQRVHSAQRLPDGRVRLLFSDPDGVLAPDASRFEIQHTSSLGGTAPVWVTNPAGVSISNGRFLFEDQTSGSEPMRFYRILER